MVWLVQAVEKQGEDSSKLGKWRLIARSDEGGGVHGLCDHDHDSLEEACNCPDAIRNKQMITGIHRAPLRPTNADLAAIAYKAYGDSTGNKNYRGEPMPEYEALPDSIRAAWEAAVGAVEQRLNLSK